MNETKPPSTAAVPAAFRAALSMGKGQEQNDALLHRKGAHRMHDPVFEQLPWILLVKKKTRVC